MESSCHGALAAADALSALDYLIGEKLIAYAEMAVTRPEFAGELPSFVEKSAEIFSAEGIRVYVVHLDRMRVLEDKALSTEPVDGRERFPRSIGEDAREGRHRDC